MSPIRNVGESRRRITMKVACYARVSSERQAEKDLSIPAQLKALKKYALERDWEVVAEYIDEAESARTVNRPRFKEMIATAKRKSKPFEAILVWKLSRFARNREDSVIYKSLLRKHGVQIISINEPVDDSAAGKLLEGMIEVIDEFYSTNLSEDTLRGMKENVERGFRSGGGVPFGYRAAKINVGGIQKSKLEPEEVEASIPRRVFQMCLGGEGGKDIAKTLNRDGLRTRAGKPWGSTTINYMLRNEVYTGVLVWAGKNGESIRVSNAHPALIPREDFDKVQQLLADRRPRLRHPRTLTSQYLLSSLLHCARCGAPMIGCAAKSGQFFYYRCNNALRRDPRVCQSGWLPKNKVEGFVIERLKRKVLTDDNLAALVGMVNEEVRLLAGRRQERLQEIDRQLESVSQKLLKYYLAFEKGTMSDEDAAPRIRELRAEQTRLQSARDVALAELEDTEPKELDTEQVLEYAKDLRALLSRGTFMEQKAFLRSFIRKIDFEPGHVAIDYTIPMPIEKDRTSAREVLSIKQRGSGGWTRTSDQAVNSRPLYR
jgi:site-specific DNA recombinase